MPAPLVVPTYHIEDLERFPSDGNRYELLNGVLLVTPAPTLAHQLVITRLLVSIENYLAPERLAHAVAPGATETGPNTHLEPDVLVFPTSEPLGPKWGSIRRWWLAVEVFSQSSRRYDRDYKRDAYLALGIDEVWLVDWVEQTVFVTSRGGPKDARYDDALSWHPQGMAAPLILDLKELFRDLDPSGYWGS
ncbi:MAG TPA: Uma2 family endonuclease [Gemmatimonadales bacterium]|nr:Uma2 family endonuclease [Gemmatimonadales bacterium]